MRVPVLAYFLLIFFFWVPTTSSNGQQIGNEWIKENTSYFKIAIVNDGIVKINAAELISKFPEFQSLNPDFIHMYKDGNEQALLVEVKNTSSFSLGDNLFFYGEKNKGELDQKLFTNLSAQAHQAFSFYSDTSYYFISIDSSFLGLRYSKISPSTQNATLENHFIYEKFQNFSEDYFYGKVYASYASLSEYTEGEGYVGNQFGLGNSQIRTISTPFIANFPTIIPCEIYLVGRSNAPAINADKNHHVKIEFSGASNYASVYDSTFGGYKALRLNFNLLTSDLNENNLVKTTIINDLGALTDFVSLSYIKISYPRKFELGINKTLKFKFKNSIFNKVSLLQFPSKIADSLLLFNLNAHTYTEPIFANDTSNFSTAFLPEASNFYIQPFKENYFSRAISIEKVNLNKTNRLAIETDFIIISSKKLNTSATNYLNYRKSNGIPSSLIFVEDLYNEFSFGQHHPLAIKRFIDYLSMLPISKPNHILLLGKGQQSNLMRNPVSFSRDLVPSIGTPASDLLYVSSLDFSEIPASIGIGRVAAETNQEVQVYLNKLIAYESNNSDSIWRKNIIHITGGRNTGENDLYTSSLNVCEYLASDTSLGAKISNYNKKVNEPVTNSFKEQIVKKTNEGVGLITYFGHGANYVVEVNFGETNELNNQGKYPIYFLNGCSLGNPNFDNSLGENFVFAQDRGAIAWFAGVDVGYPSYLAEFDEAFYNNAFQRNYGNAIGNIINKSIEQFVDVRDTLNLIHARQFYFQGDPLLKFYAPILPDYAIEPQNAIIESTNANETNDTVILKLITRNNGKALKDSLTVQVTQTFEDQTSLTFPLQKFAAIYNLDTLFIAVPNPNQQSKGLCKFNIYLDSDNKITESNEGNNAIQFEHLFPSDALFAISPMPFGIIKDSVNFLHIQSSNFNLKNATYYFELDTILNFSSNYLKSFQKIGNASCKVKIPFALIPSTTYYWRAKIIIAGVESNWIINSFNYNPQIKLNWEQKHYQQLLSNNLVNLTLDSNSKNLDFVTNGVEITIKTRGDNARTDSIERRIRFNNAPPVYPPSNPEGIGIIAIDPISLERFSKSSKYNSLANTPDYSFDVYKYSGVYFFNLGIPDDIDSLIDYLHSIPDGFVVAAYNGRNSNFKSLPELALKAFEELGVAKVRTLENGDPYAFVGFKGSPIGTAIERVFDPSSSIPSDEQFLRIDYFHKGKWNAGSMISNRIGPVSEWEKVYVKLNKEITDQSSLRVIGIKADKSKSTLITSNQADSVALNFIDAQTYPYIQLELTLSDSINRTAAIFNSWSVSYSELPEFSFDPNIANYFYASSVLDGDSVKLKIGINNFSKTEIDSLAIFTKLIKNDRTEILLSTDYLQSINQTDSIIFEKRISSRNLTKENKIVLVAKQINQAENFQFNNTISKSFTVINDVRAPILQVSIDGRIPINKEIISPKPTIIFTATDENKILLLKDTSIFTIEIKRPGSNLFELVPFSSSSLQFIAASSITANLAKVIYTPSFTIGGIYSLRIKTKDASGNSVKTAYEIDLEVVIESSITNFYPYPNPFTNSTQFVFTLTGEYIPTDIKIQIMTVSGKIVREISKSELGNIKIGNNISEYKWNGCDEFGDRLATGVYFYRVLMRNNFELKKRETSADKYFEKGFGKLYIMN